MTRRRHLVCLLMTLALVAGADLLLPFPALSQGAVFAGSDDRDDKEDKSDKEDKDDKDDDSGDDGGDDDGGDDDGQDDDGEDDDGSTDGGSSGSGSAARPAKDARAAAVSADMLRRLGPAGVRRLLADGSRESLIAGVYERFDSRGRLVERRKASAADKTRLGSMTGARAVIQIRGDRVIVTDHAGWREEIRAGRYRLTDPRGNLVTRRPAGPEDLERIRAILAEG